MSSLSRHVSFDVTEHGNVTNVLDKVKNRHVSIILRHDQCDKTMKFTRKNAFNPWVHTCSTLHGQRKDAHRSMIASTRRGWRDSLITAWTALDPSLIRVYYLCSTRHYHVATSMSIATCRTQHRKIPVAQLPHQSCQKHSTPVHYMTSRLHETSK